jgi:hypothetical protein
MDIKYEAYEQIYILSEQGEHYIGSWVLEGLQDIMGGLQEQPEQAFISLYNLSTNHTFEKPTYAFIMHAAILFYF